jgi:hypothetical protein
MANQCIAQTPSAYGFPLLIKGLLESGVTRPRAGDRVC